MRSYLLLGVGGRNIAKQLILGSLEPDGLGSCQALSSVPLGSSLSLCASISVQANG